MYKEQFFYSMNAQKEGLERNGRNTILYLTSGLVRGKTYKNPCS